VNLLRSIIPWAVCVFLSTAIPVCAQQGEEIDYPTLISAVYDAGDIRITFEPLCDMRLRYRLYRTTAPLSDAALFASDAGLKNATLFADISKDEIPYTDTPKEDGRYYYAVTVIENGIERTGLVPFQNFTPVPVDYSPKPVPVERISIVSTDDIHASVSFTPYIKGYRYSLFKRTRPIGDSPEGKPDFVLDEGQDRFRLKIDREVPCYFLVTVANRLGIENRSVVPGKNTNTEPFLLRLKAVKAAAKENAFPKKSAVSAEYLIERNLKRNFYRGRYSNALVEFETILRRKDLSAYERSTAYFYMGQCCYYKGTIKAAIRYFILCNQSGQYAAEAEIWIGRCLEMVE
jgi:hypothetical protein